MITYDYFCDNCEASFEIQQSIKDKTLVKCPKCNKLKLRRVFHVPILTSIKGEPTTLGSLAERNAQKMSKEERARRAQEYKTKKKAARGLPFETREPERIPEGYEPFYKKAQTKSSKDVAKMTPEQKKKYIEEG